MHKRAIAIMKKKLSVCTLKLMCGSSLPVRPKNLFLHGNVLLTRNLWVYYPILLAVISKDQNQIESLFGGIILCLCVYDCELAWL